VNKIILPTIALLTCGMVHAGNNFEYYHKWDACSQLDGIKIYNDTGKKGIIGEMANFDVIKNNDVTYALLGAKTQISAKKQYHCEFPKFKAKDCLYGTGSYAFWESDNYAGSYPTLARNWEDDGVFNEDARDFEYEPRNRGKKFITSVITEKNFKVLVSKGIPEPAPKLPSGIRFEYPSLPYLQNYDDLNDLIWKGLVSWVQGQQSDGGVPDQYAYIPMCDAIEVRVQNKPKATVTVNYQDDGHRIAGTVFSGGSVDLFSKSNQENVPVKYQIQKYVISQWNGSRCDVIEDQSSWVTVRNLSSTSSFNFDYYSCDVQFRTRVFDGSFYSNWAVKTIFGTAGSTSGGAGGGSAGGGSGTCTGTRCDFER
jgi:hypothetical protein